MTETGYRLVRTDAPIVAAPRLDPSQLAVVDHGGGPLLVLAGPGTGKTTTLVETVVARVAAGVPVERMLMLTFSRRAANEMRDRVAQRLGRTVREPIARTLHSYAFGLLRLANRRSSATDDPLPPPRLLAGPEQDVIVRELLSGRGPGAWPAGLRPALGTAAFAGELRDLLLRAVERGLLGVDLAELGRRRDRPDWVAAGQFLTEYEEVTALAKPGAYDPAELIRSAVNALRSDPELLAAERARRRHILVDEYQDTDPAQAELLALLADGADELVLVGDPDQSIYAFRGADEAALREVDERFGRGGAAVPVVALTVCRRSGPNLVAATRRVAARLPGRGEQRVLVADGGSGSDSVEVRLFASTSAEANHVAGVLRRAHLDGLPWSRMAVLVRSTTAVLGTLRRALLTAGVPVAVRGDDLPLAEQPAVAVLLELLRCVLDPTELDDEAVAERLLLGPVGRADAVSLQRLRRAVTRLVTPGEAPRLGPLLRSVREAKLLPDHLRWSVTRVQAVLAAGREAVDAAGSAEEVLWAMWSASGLAARWTARSASGGTGGAAADRDLDAVVALFDAAARFTDRLPRAGVAEFARHVADQQIPGDGYSGRGGEPEAVTILTAHAAKGLEWDLVCVAGVQEGRWPDLRVRGSLLGTDALVDAVAGIDVPPGGSSASRLAEERRLFYVAATRARHRLVVTAVRGEDEQPSRFLDELDPPAADDERPLATAEPPAHLAGLVAALRAVVTDWEDTDGTDGTAATAADRNAAATAATAADRNAAATELARLADAGVAGADPDRWWGMAPLSSPAPVADPDRPVPVSPSRIDSFLRCELRTVLQDLGAVNGQQLSASLGTLVHEVAAEAPPEATLPELQAMVDERWGALDFGAQWFGVNERARAGEILTRLVEWMRSSRDRLDLVGIEQPFHVELGDAVLTGRVDRVERDADGQLVVVDLKTGKQKVKADELAEHPQLGAYQLAVAEGGFGDGERPGGALLVQLAVKAREPEQWQSALADRAWIDEAVSRVASRMRGAEFTAQLNGYCPNCDLQQVCPLQNGRQVTT